MNCYRALSAKIAVMGSMTVEFSITTRAEGSFLFTPPVPLISRALLWNGAKAVWCCPNMLCLGRLRPRSTPIIAANGVHTSCYTPRSILLAAGYDTL